MMLSRSPILPGGSLTWEIISQLDHLKEFKACHFIFTRTEVAERLHPQSRGESSIAMALASSWSLLPL